MYFGLPHRQPQGLFQSYLGSNYACTSNTINRRVNKLTLDLVSKDKSLQSVDIAI